MKKIFSFLIAALFSASMWAATETTVYYAIPDAAKGSYTLKMNTLKQTGTEVWEQKIMDPTEYTYEGVPVYSCSFTDIWDGVQVIQFQLYDGDNFVSQQTGVNDWKAVSKYNGKLFLYTKQVWVNLDESVVNDFYLKNCWNGGSWAWSDAMTYQSAGMYVLNNVVLGSKELNVNTLAEDNIGGQYITEFSGEDFDALDTIDLALNFSTMAISAVMVGKKRPVIDLKSNILNPSWSASDPFVVDNDPAHPTASLIIKDFTGTTTPYEFGIEIDGTWRSSSDIIITSADNSQEINAGSGNAQIVMNENGDYTFTWAFNTNILTVTYPSQGGGTAIDNTEAGNAAVKRLVNGQLVIVKGDKTFNALGTEVK